MKTTIPGVFVLKLPAYRFSPTRLAAELNPVDAEDAPTKRCGLLLRSSSELDAFREILQDDRLSTILRAMDAVNPEMTMRTQRDRDDILEL